MAVSYRTRNFYARAKLLLLFLSSFLFVAECDKNEEREKTDGGWGGGRIRSAQGHLLFLRWETASRWIGRGW